MLVQCPSCHTTYKVSDSLITTPNPTFRCSRCKHIFVLGLKIEPAPVGETTAAPAMPPSQGEEPELSFSSTPPEKTEITKEASRQVPESREAEQPPEAESMTQAQAKPSESPTSTSPPPPEAIPAPSPVLAEPQLTPDIERSLPLAQEKDDSWSIAPSPSQSEEPFTMPEEKPSLQMDSPSESAPDFGADWQEAYPILDERDPDSALDPYRDRPLSTVPYISLFGALLLIFSLLTLMYQAQPKSIEAALKGIPWLGPTILKNNHLQHGISLQALRPSFETIQGNREVFVLSGIAVNRNNISVREVRVEGHIFNAEGKEIDRQTISVGNALSSKIIRDLTAQEISILQRLNPQKRFEIPPDESAGFVVVFLKPRAEVKNFSCRVAAVEGGV